MAQITVNVKLENKLSESEVKKDISEMTRKELADYGRGLFSKLNKRITRLENAKGVISPALESVEKSGGKFYMKGLNRNQLLKELSRAIVFDSSATGTVSGARKYTNHLKDIVGEKVHDKDYVGKIFDLVHRVQTLNPTISNAIGSEEVAKIVSGVVDDSIDLEMATMEEYEEDLNRDFDDAIEEITRKLMDKFDGMFDGLDKSFTMDI